MISCRHIKFKMMREYSWRHGLLALKIGCIIDIGFFTRRNEWTDTRKEKSCEGRILYVIYIKRKGQIWEVANQGSERWRE